MSVGSASSLFDAAAVSPLGGAVGWVGGTLLGGLATAFCVIAIGLLGLSMLGGRLPVRHGLRVILGCFVLLGAPVIATAFLALGETGFAESPKPPSPVALPDREALPPADYDPYAGASLRRR